MCHIHGFTPYFYIPAPDGFDAGHCRHFKEALNHAVISDMRSNKDSISEAVLAVDSVMKESKWDTQRVANVNDLKTSHQ